MHIVATAIAAVEDDGRVHDEEERAEQRAKTKCCLELDSIGRAGRMEISHQRLIGRLLLFAFTADALLRFRGGR